MSKGAERFYEPEVREEGCEIVFSRYNWLTAFMSSPAETDQEDSSLMTSFHSTGRCYAGFWGGVTSILTQLLTLGATIMTSLARLSHGFHNGKNGIGVTNCFPTGFKICLLYRRKHMPGTLNLTKNLELWNS